MLELGKKRERQVGALFQLGGYSYNHVIEELIVRIIIATHSYNEYARRRGLWPSL